MEKRRFNEPKAKEYEELVISVNRVTKVTKGGRRFRFAATVVVGNRKGTVGFGTGKANEVQDAVKKAIQSATKNVVRIPLVEERTLPHEAIGESGAARVLIKPAKAGTGIIAGGAARPILELAGIKNITAKNHGSNNKINTVRATFKALQSLQTAEQIAKARGKNVEDL